MCQGRLIGDIRSVDPGNLGNSFSLVLSGGEELVALVTDYSDMHINLVVGVARSELPLDQRHPFGGECRHRPRRRAFHQEALDRSCDRIAAAIMPALLTGIPDMDIGQPSMRSRAPACSRGYLSRFGLVGAEAAQESFPVLSADRDPAAVHSRRLASAG